MSTYFYIEEYRIMRDLFVFDKGISSIYKYLPNAMKELVKSIITNRIRTGDSLKELREYFYEIVQRDFIEPISVNYTLLKIPSEEDCVICYQHKTLRGDMPNIKHICTGGIYHLPCILQWYSYQSFSRSPDSWPPWEVYMVNRGCPVCRQRFSSKKKKKSKKIKNKFSKKKIFKNKKLFGKTNRYYDNNENGRSIVNVGENEENEEDEEDEEMEDFVQIGNNMHLIKYIVRPIHLDLEYNDDFITVERVEDDMYRVLRLPQEYYNILNLMNIDDFDLFATGDIYNEFELERKISIVYDIINKYNMNGPIGTFPEYLFV